ncbi:ABC transporter permease [Bacillus sp. Bva_UNVM-123]|uniref:ABC transporter permease n=1 Tax=Bacillus sp. Bva_UNVM-123 TaxID=2829798 RepID=UPI00391F6E7C
MNIINRLTLRHLKENKRRTLVTIVGVIISVAMITAVATLGVSFMDLMKRQTIAENGEWHVQYTNVNDDQLTEIEKDEATKRLIISDELGYATLQGSQIKSKPYLFIQSFNEVGLNEFPIELSKGRLPQAENEIIISEEIAANAKVNYKIGDQITVDIGDRHAEGEETPLSQNDPLQMSEEDVSEILSTNRSETFTVVGTIKRPNWEPAWSPGYTVITYVDQSLLKETDTVDAIVVLNKVNYSLYKHAEKLAQKNNIEKVFYNSELLRYYGLTNNDNFKSTLFSLTAIIMLVIIIGSVSLIYNAFSISVSERSRHLGMLSSVGATKKQKQNSVFFEGAVIGAVSIPIGIIAGLAGIAITFMFINSIISGALNVSEKLEVVITPISLIAACAVSIITIFISVYSPARKASKISAIDAIRQTQDVKLSGKIVKTSKLIRKIFGMEADIGLKNLKRNKRRYKATVFSLVISIILFLSVSFFTGNLKKSIELTQDGFNFDIQVSNFSGNTAELEPLKNLEYVTKSSMIEQIHFYSWINKEALPDILKEQVNIDKQLLQDGKYNYIVNVYALDEENFKSYAKEVGANLQKLQNPNSLSAIIINKLTYEDKNIGKVVETKSVHMKPGEKIELYDTYDEIGNQKYLNEVEIDTITDQFPMGVRPAEIGGINIIVSKNTLDQLVNEEMDYGVGAYLYLNSSDPMATQKAIEEVKDAKVSVFNVYQMREQDEQTIMLMSVFTYGFIVLISLISIANIFNTISTSISLRKREFAMLRSVGMTPKGFNKMINYESAFYGIKALLYGLPISIVTMYFIYFSLRNSFEYGFALPWLSILYVIAAIFIIVSLAMLYSIKKIKKENIIDGLKQENI